MNKSTQIISGIYKILNTKNNKVYIGSSINIEKRFSFLLLLRHVLSKILLK